VLLPVPFLRSVGYGGLLVPLASALVTLTLLPVLLATVGPRLDWPRRGLRRDTAASRLWTRWASGVVRHRWLAILAALAVLLPLGVAALGLRLGDPPADTLATSGPARDGLTRLERAGVGSGALGIDAASAIYGAFPLLLVAVALVTFVMLTRAFRSVLLSLKAIVLNLLSIGAAYGVLVLVWQDGYGSQTVWGIPATGAIAMWVPLMTFAFLYGLSMDYEVFLLSRMREEYTPPGRPGPRSCRDWAGILLDATVLRALLVPALVALLGRWNWWLPAWAARPLRLPPSPPARDAGPTATEQVPARR